MQNISGSSQTGLLQVRDVVTIFCSSGKCLLMLVSIFQSMKNFGLHHVMRMYLKGLSSENPQVTAEVRQVISSKCKICIAINRCYEF